MLLEHVTEFSDGKKMEKFAPLQVVFARYDEPLPFGFTYSAEPNHLSLRQRKKWYSQRMGFFLLSHMLDRYKLGKYQFTDIQKTASGRPYLPDSSVDFNMSHSGDWVAIIFSLSTPTQVVGIDIEHPQKERRYSELLRHYAKPEEIAEVNDPRILPELPSLEKRFYLTWCLREAVLKSQGVGIAKLSEVQHSLSQRIIHSAYCPQGTLCFYPHLPFYLAYFFEQSETMLSLPSLSQWRSGRFVSIQTAPPIVYQVNPR